MSFGFGGIPSSAMPAATVSEVTRTILVPCWTAAAIWLASFCISSSSIFPSLVVMPLVPTFTTTNLETIKHPFSAQRANDFAVYFVLHIYSSSLKNTIPRRTIHQDSAKARRQNVQRLVA